MSAHLNQLPSTDGDTLQHRPSSPQRPRGIVVLVVLQALGAIGALINLIYLLPLQKQRLLERLSSMQPSSSQSDAVNQFTGSLTTFVEDMATSQIRTQQVISIITIPLSLLLGWGLWKLRPWARVVAIVCYGLSILTVCNGNVITALIAGTWLVYLTRPHVAAAFQA